MLYTVNFSVEGLPIMESGNIISELQLADSVINLVFDDNNVREICLEFLKSADESADDEEERYNFILKDILEHPSVHLPEARERVEVDIYYKGKTYHVFVTLIMKSLYRNLFSV